MSPATTSLKAKSFAKKFASYQITYETFKVVIIPELTDDGESIGYQITTGVPGFAMSSIYETVGTLRGAIKSAKHRFRKYRWVAEGAIPKDRMHIKL